MRDSTRFGGLKIASMNVHYFRYPFSYFLEQQRELGFDSFVFWGSVPHIWVDQFGYEDVSTLREALAEHGVKALAYAARPYNYSLFAPKGSMQRSYSADYYRLSIDAARELGMNRICVDLWGALRDAGPAAQYENCLDMLASLCAYAEERSCTVVIGNVPGNSSALMNTLMQVRRLQEDVRMDNCEVALDVCAALESGETVTDWLDAFGQQLSIVYLADGCDAGTGYPLGHGCYPIAEALGLLRERAYRGAIAIKMDREKTDRDPVGADRDNVAWLRRHLDQGL